MSENGIKRVLGGPIDPIPMEPSTRKTMDYRFVKPGDHVPYRVLGGTVMEETNEFGVVISGEGPFYLSETLLRNWILLFERERQTVERQDAQDALALSTPE